MSRRLAGRLSLRSVGDELERHGVHAVAVSGRRRTVGKDVAEMAVATRAADLRAHHAVVRVADFAHVCGIERREETRPARAGLELAARLEQREAAQPADVGAGLVIVEQRAAEGALGAVIEKDPALFGREARSEAVALCGGQRAEVVAGGGFARGGRYGRVG